MALDFRFEVPRLNSLRSRPISYGVIDYNDFFSRLDMMTQRSNYQKGDNNVSYFVDWVNGKEIRLQVQCESTSTPPIQFVLKNVNTGIETSLSYSTITPIGWTRYPVYDCTYTPTTDGIYFIYIRFENTSPYDPEDTADMFLYTDQFRVRSDNDVEKDLVWFKYSNTYNKFNTVFNDEYFNAFFTGLIDAGESTTENTITKEDDGTSLNQSRSYGAVNFVLTDIHRTQIRQIELICQCNDLMINGQHVVVETIPEKERIGTSDLYNVTINATFANNDYYMDYFDKN